MNSLKTDPNAACECRLWMRKRVRRAAGGDMSGEVTRWFEWMRWVLLMGVMAWTASSSAQETANRVEPPSDRASSESVTESIRKLREQVRELQEAVAGMRSDWQRARAETADLRRELDQVRAGAEPRNADLRGAKANSSTPDPETVAGPLQNGTANEQRLEERKPDDQKEDQKKDEHAASLEEEYQ